MRSKAPLPSSNKSLLSTLTLCSDEPPLRRLDIALDLSTASTDRGQLLQYSSVTRPVPQPASMAASSPLVSIRPDTSPQPVCGAESSRLPASHSRSKSAFLVYLKMWKMTAYGYIEVGLLGQGGVGCSTIRWRSWLISESGPASLAAECLERAPLHGARLLSSLANTSGIAQDEDTCWSEFEGWEPGCRGWPRGAGAPVLETLRGQSGEALSSTRAEGGKCCGRPWSEVTGVEGLRALGGDHAALARVCGAILLAFAPGGSTPGQIAELRV